MQQITRCGPAQRTLSKTQHALQKPCKGHTANRLCGYVAALHKAAQLFSRCLAHTTLAIMIALDAQHTAMQCRQTSSRDHTHRYPDQDRYRTHITVEQCALQHAPQTADILTHPAVNLPYHGASAGRSCWIQGHSHWCCSHAASASGSAHSHVLLHQPQSAHMRCCVRPSTVALLGVNA